MERDNCTSIYATDLLITVDAATPCDAPIIPWIVFQTIFFLLSLWTSIERTLMHRKRTEKRALPLMVLVSWFGTLVYLLLLILPFFHVNAVNGGFLVLLTWLSLVFTIKSCLLIFKLIKLGHRIIPVKIDVLGHRSSELGKVDRVLFALFSSVFLLSILLFIFLDILVFALPSYNETWIGVGFGIVCGKYLLTSAMICYQIQRCVNVMNKSLQNTSSLVDDLMTLKLRRAIHSMKLQQIVVAASCVVSITFIALLVAFVIPRSYISAIIITSLEVLIQWLFLLSSKRKKVSNRNSQVTSSIRTEDKVVQSNAV